MKTDILVAILTGSERHFWIHPNLLLRCIEMPAQLASLRKRSGTIRFTTIHGTTPVDAARNAAVKYTLESGADFLLMVDNDVVPAPGFLRVLDEIADRKIVGFPCPFLVGRVGQERIAFGAGKKVDGLNYVEQFSPGWCQVDFVGTGCLLVHRDVFLALGDPWFQCPRDIEVAERVYAGEDFAFCERAATKGFSMWTHASYPCSHYHTLDLTRGAPRS